MTIRIAHKPGDAVWLVDEGRPVQGHVTMVTLSLPDVLEAHQTDSIIAEYTVHVPETRLIYSELLAYAQPNDLGGDLYPEVYVYATKGMAADYLRYHRNRIKA